MQASVLQWFVTEQVEERRSGRNREQLEMIGKGSHAS